MQTSFHVSMKTCKHESADCLFPFSGGNLDCPYFVTRQSDL